MHPHSSNIQRERMRERERREEKRREEESRGEKRREEEREKVYINHFVMIYNQVS